MSDSSSIEIGGEKGHAVKGQSSAIVLLVSSMLAKVVVLTQLIKISAAIILARKI